MEPASLTVPFICVVLVVAAAIDGWKLKVPNWLTFPLVVGGWAAALAVGGWTALGMSVLGTAVGLALLLPAYAVGGMGAGDVKLLAGVGAWIGPLQGGLWHVFYAFCASAVVGAVLAIAMVLYRRAFRQHWLSFYALLVEFVTVRDPRSLSELAVSRKPSMLLLPYAIPLAIGSIGYFFWAGLVI